MKCYYKEVCDSSLFVKDWQFVWHMHVTSPEVYFAPGGSALCEEIQVTCMLNKRTVLLYKILKRIPE